MAGEGGDPEERANPHHLSFPQHVVSAGFRRGSHAYAVLYKSRSSPVQCRYSYCLGWQSSRRPKKQKPTASRTMRQATCAARCVQSMYAHVSIEQALATTVVVCPRKKTRESKCAQNVTRGTLAPRERQQALPVLVDSSQRLACARKACFISAWLSIVSSSEISDCY